LVVDGLNYRIRKVDSLGNVTTLAGNGTPGFTDGAANVAQFLEPKEIKIAPNGDIYVTDYENHAIRLINPTTGAVSTYAGDGTPGSTDGSLAVAKFHRPRDIDFDSQGNMYVTDLMNNKIRKITPGGTVSTFVGSGVAGGTDGMGTAATLNIPTGIVISSSDYIYVTDGQGHRVRMISPAGLVTTIAGTGVAGFQDGPGASAQFNLLQDICLNPSETHLYLGDRNNNRIRVLEIGKNSIEDIENTVFQSLSLYPNPANTDVMIDLTAIFNENVVVSIYNIAGELVKTVTEKSENIIRIDTKDLVSSSYLFIIRVGDQQVHKTVLISR
jgi:hypothetical protein